MRVRIRRGDITDICFKPPIPVMDQDGRRCGSMTRIWFDGEYTVGEFEGVPEDFDLTREPFVQVEGQE